MKYTQLLLLTGFGLTIISCSKSSSTPDPTPVEEDLSTPVAGVYKLTKTTPRNSTATITGVGSLTITPVDKSTIKISQVRNFTSTAGGVSSIENTNESNKLSKDGTTYIIKTLSGTQWATISGNKISTTDNVNATLTTAITIDTEYTKQ